MLVVGLPSGLDTSESSNCSDRERGDDAVDLAGFVQGVVEARELGPAGRREELVDRVAGLSIVMTVSIAWPPNSRW